MEKNEKGVLFVEENIYNTNERVMGSHFGGKPEPRACLRNTAIKVRSSI